jgi:isoleucyl-tRNA synthetase
MTCLGEALMTKETLEHVITKLEENGVNYWWTAPVSDLLVAKYDGISVNDNIFFSLNIL